MNEFDKLQQVELAVNKISKDFSHAGDAVCDAMYLVKAILTAAKTANSPDEIQAALEKAEQES